MAFCFIGVLYFPCPHSLKKKKGKKATQSCPCCGSGRGLPVVPAGSGAPVTPSPLLRPGVVASPAAPWQPPAWQPDTGSGRRTLDSRGRRVRVSPQSPRPVAASGLTRGVASGAGRRQGVRFLCCRLQILLRVWGFCFLFF